MFLPGSSISPDECERVGNGVSLALTSKYGKILGSKKTKAELIAENEAMSRRLQTLEDRPGQERRTNYLLRIFIDALTSFGFLFNADGRILQAITGDQNPQPTTSAVRKGMRER